MDFLQRRRAVAISAGNGNRVRDRNERQLSAQRDVGVFASEVGRVSDSMIRV